MKSPQPQKKGHKVLVIQLIILFFLVMLLFMSAYFRLHKQSAEYMESKTAEATTVQEKIDKVVEKTNYCLNNTSSLACVFASSGEGVGIFAEYMATALPPLLVILAIVGVIVAIGRGIFSIVGRHTS